MNNGASRSLPDFPWDRLAPYGRQAREHPGGIVDLSVGTPVDPTPQVARDALTGASDAPGYPLTIGTPQLREAISGYLVRRFGAPADGLGVLPTVGSKELVALLPTLLDLPAGAQVLLPRLAYPTYDVSARLAGCRPVPVDPDPGTWPAPGGGNDPAGTAGMVWLNTPSNPSGRTATAAELRAAIAWGRRHGMPVVVDECYAELGWESDPVSVLHPDVTGGDLTGVLAVHSLSKRSNLAGYRAAFVAGDADLIGRLTEVRRHAGLMMPAPVQAAMAAALADDEHVAEQRERYRRRRDVLRPALEAAGYAVDPECTAGLYLWCRVPQGDCWAAVQHLAGLGILVAPGEFYGAAGAGHVRVALTGTDERIAVAVARLQAT